MSELQSITAKKVLQKCWGFTLIELMIVLAILSVLLFVAVPNFDSVMADSEVDKARYNLATGLALARTEAVKRGEDVTVCHGTTGTCGTGTGSVNWTNLGWKVVVDSSDEILRVDDSPNDKVTVTYDCGDFISFNSVGYRNSSGSGECEYSFSDTRGASITERLCIAASGRVRMSDVDCGS